MRRTRSDKTKPKSAFVCGIRITKFISGGEQTESDNGGEEEEEEEESEEEELLEPKVLPERVTRGRR